MEAPERPVGALTNGNLVFTCEDILGSELALEQEKGSSFQRRPSKRKMRQLGPFEESKPT